MADESSSIALQLAINLKGLTKLTQLNAALKELKTNAVGFQRIATGAKDLKNLGAGASAAAKGMRELVKEQNASANAFRKNDALGKDIANIQKQQAAASKKAADQMKRDRERLAKEIAGTDKNMAAQFARLQKDQTRAHAAAQSAQVRATQQSAAREDAINRASQARYMADLQRRRAEYQRYVNNKITLTNRLRAAEEQYDAVFRAGFRLQMVGNDMKQVGMTVMRTLGGMASEFGNFEFMVNRAAGAMGIATSELDGQVNVYDQFQQKIFDVSRELKLFAPSDVAKATYFWAATTGQQVDTLGELESVMKSVNPLMKIAAMTETDYETAIKGVYGILTQYNMGLEDTQYVTEKLHAATQLTAAEFPDLVNSFKMVGPVARANSVTFEDMLDLLGKMADAGIRGTMSGRAFRQLFIQLNKPSVLAKKALDDLWASTEKFGGQSYIDMVFPQGKFVGVVKYVNLLAEATENLTEHERNALLARITTANELPVLTALVVKQIEANKGLADQTGKTGDIGADSAKRFRESWELLADSWNGVVGGFQRGVEILRIQIGKRLADIFTPVMKALTTALEQVSNWASDARNQEVIDFFLKIIGFSAGFLAVAGSLTVFVGALTSLAAASVVAVRAFGPLAGKFAGIVGVIGVVVGALVRNFEYIREVGAEVIQNLTEAFGDAESGISGLGEAFQSFAGMTAPIFDAIIRVIGELVLKLSELIKWVSKNELMMSALSVVAQGLAVILSVKLLAGFLGIFNIAKALTGPLALIVKLFGAAIVPTSSFVGVLGTAPSKLGALKGALAGVARFLGPAGILAAGAVAFTILYEKSDAFKGIIDEIFTDFSDKVADLRAETAELAADFGVYSQDIKRAFDLDPEFQAMQKNVAALRAEYEGANDADFEGRYRKDIRKDLLKAEAELEESYKNRFTTVQDWVNKMNDLGMNLTAQDYMAQVRTEIAAGAKTFDEARAAADDYFNTMFNNRVSLDAQATQMLASVSKGVGSVIGAGPGGRTSAIMTESVMGTIKQNLINMKSRVSPEVAKQIDDMISSGVLAGIEASGEGTEVTDAAKKAVGDIANDLLSASKGFMDLDKRLGEVMKEAFKPARQVKSVFSSYMKGWISKGFRDADGHFHVEAALTAKQSIRDLGVQFQTYMDVLPPAEADAFVTKTINEFKTTFKNGIPKDVPQDMRDELFAFITNVYETAGKPLPQWVLDLFTTQAGEIPGAAGEGVKDNKTDLTDPVVDLQKDAVRKMEMYDGMYSKGSGATSGLNAGMKKNMQNITDTADRIAKKTKGIARWNGMAYTWGYHFGSQYNKGLKNAKGDIIATAANIATGVWKYLHQTTAEIGPLKDTDVWGYHLGQNIEEGMRKSIPLVESASRDMSHAIAGGYSLASEYTGGTSFETTAAKTIKVLVEVTSPDGSVDRVKAAELERGLMSNDLLMSIEHMSTVG